MWRHSIEPGRVDQPLQKTPVHYFPLLEHRPGPCCGEWRDGHTWTVVSSAVTCPRCRLLMTLVEGQRTEHGAGVSPPK